MADAAIAALDAEADARLAEAVSENARLFNEATIRACDETLGRQKHEIRSLTAQVAAADARVEAMREAICDDIVRRMCGDGNSVRDIVLMEAYEAISALSAKGSPT